MTTKKTKRKDTKLESEGAEFLVLGHLLIIGINSYKAYVNYSGYDLIATNPSNNKICKIQVKGRWAIDYDKSFPIKSLESDFIVHVAFNRGFPFYKKNTKDDISEKPPQFYIFPTRTIEKYRKPGKWHKRKNIRYPKLTKYENNIV